MSTRTRAHIAVYMMTTNGSEAAPKRFCRGDLAQRYAQEIAESLARSWAANVAAGRPGGNVLAVTVVDTRQSGFIDSWDIAEIASRVNLGERHLRIRVARTPVPARSRYTK